LPHLGNGQQVILSEFGHVADVWDLQPEATMHLLTTFYDTGVVDDSLFTYQPMNFDVGLGFPALAKIALAVVILLPALLLAALLLGLVWLIIRWIKRRRASQVLIQKRTNNPLTNTFG